ncbi:hypothetical protein LQF12_11230 [Ruania suaedae]|uniref:hypothetical protein n=1 Tax=Ruania suaedae TaxID=2897774 RepID=UPI001E4DD20E|nr:hypothetical protein [Ruania suaedae]UFU02083.1 hypothetical protein LQF12_11230 [Ruania suaedae]
MQLTLRSLPALAAAAALTTASLAGAFGAPSAGAEATSAPVGAACAEGAGVSVVVDFTDVGGDIEVGCAEGDPATGREALESAGFTPEDSQPGLICTIDGLPDPCPEEFDGNYWSYWSAEAEGEWTSYQVGADEADPAPGALEGWRYFDGSEGPGIAPADALAVAEPVDDADQSTDQGADEPATPVLPILAVVIGIVLVVAIALVLRRRSRR